ncbi:MAG: hypothetical protein U9Q66_02475, partial [Patescibacteria group bacterium]|nr:hypothetical protein [Patescibacteria group bacterium]
LKLSVTYLSNNNQTLTISVLFILLFSLKNNSESIIDSIQLISSLEDTSNSLSNQISNNSILDFNTANGVLIS